MQTSISEVSILTIIISTLLILVLVGMVVYYLFLYQQKRFLHEKQVQELHDTFTQTLLQSKLEIQEVTLDHIAKELHANFSQLVSLININLSTILPHSSDEAREGILETKSLAKQLLLELKALSASLNTDHIMHIGFIAALNNELNRMAKTKKFNVTFSKTGEEYRLRPEHEIILFRLCQEVLNNIVNYSQAELVTAALNYQEGLFELEISDNGIGFDAGEVTKPESGKASTGLLNIRKRAALIGAEVMIESAPGAGSRVSIRIPSAATT
ncbi:sensor histidine kinase [Mucilaginibacter angelicae]|uniref:Sensor histidine kinase n=1 Tax=Mucilaginibacter angelicae TaxID=869718 RepID=A0ABV6LHI8_9SPHI